MAHYARLGMIAGVVGVALVVAGGGARVFAGGQAKPTRLETVLRQMDAGSAKFQSAQADFHKDLYTKFVDDTTTETGKIYFLRKGGSTQMGARSAAQVVEFKDGKVRLYGTGSNQMQEYSVAGKNEATAQTILTLGFGGSGRDLEKAWVIEDQGTEQMSDGGKTVEVEKLDLVSRDAGVKGNYPHVTIWIDPVRDVALKQVFFAKSGDMNTAVYSNIVLNKSVDMGVFAIKCRGKCG